MSKKFFLILLSIICSASAIAQTSFYYYKGNKIPLTLNDNKVIVSISKDCNEIVERIRANVQVLSTIKDETLDIIIISRSDFENLISQDFWEEDAKSIILTSSFFTENNVEVFETPYLNVKLKNEEDFDLLASYAEKYKLKIVWNMPTMPVWYIVVTTPESKKSPLECANELFESGDFASSTPDFASPDNGANDPNIIRSLTTPTTEKSSEYYDLHGRKQETKPTKGIYILQGQKRLAGSR